jgi:hypothetical protein
MCRTEIEAIKAKLARKKREMAAEKTADVRLFKQVNRIKVHHAGGRAKRRPSGNFNRFEAAANFKYHKATRMPVEIAQAIVVGKEFTMGGGKRASSNPGRKD